MLASHHEGQSLLQAAEEGRCAGLHQGTDAKTSKLDWLCSEKVLVAPALETWDPCKVKYTSCLASLHPPCDGGLTSQLLQCSPNPRI